jgi:hypothetical protein
MSFLPTNYEVPKNGDSYYYKFEDGANTFRVLSSAVVGWLYWEDEQGNVLANPVKGCKARHVKNLEEIAEAKRRSPTFKVKHFWAFVVYNYNASQVQVLKLTQNSIMEAVTQYVRSSKWGDPKEYDFIIHKDGQGLETRYQMTVNPKAKLEAGIVKLYQDMQIDLEALFRGEDPFKQAEKVAVDPKEVEAASR